jgi:hypothetical protein
MTFCSLHSDYLEQDTLLKDERYQLKQIELLLRPFQDVTKHLEGKAVHHHHDSI